MGNAIIPKPYLLGYICGEDTELSIVAFLELCFRIFAIKKMMKSHLKYIVFVLFIFIGLSFIQKNENKIYWTKDYRLTWDDYLAKPPAASKHGAVSGVNMGPYYEFKNNILEIDTRSYFDKFKSWSKKNLQSDDALKHEQGHFDIAEIYARKFRKEITGCKFKSKNLKEKLEEKIHKIYSEYIQYQDLYDNETNHHINKEKQLVWNDKIVKELKELEIYTETQLAIEVK